MKTDVHVYYKYPDTVSTCANYFTHCYQQNCVYTVDKGIDIKRLLSNTEGLRCVHTISTQVADLQQYVFLLWHDVHVILIVVTTQVDGLHENLVKTRNLGEHKNI